MYSGGKSYVIEYRYVIEHSATHASFCYSQLKWKFAIKNSKEICTATSSHLGFEKDIRGIDIVTH